MKKLLFAGIALSILNSCSRSPEEQMLYEYQKEEVKKSLNMDIEDLDYEIKSINLFEEVLAKDSMQYYKIQLAKAWLGEEYSGKPDTLTFDYILPKMDSLVATYERIIYYNKILGKSYDNPEWETNHKLLSDKTGKVKIWKSIYDEYSKNPDSVLSLKYKASYSINNPMLNNARQTFDKFYFTDPYGNKFLQEEMVEL